jgi:hypothetical protein
MNPHRSLNIRCINETEARTARWIKPIRQETYSVSILHFEVLSVRLGNIGSCQARKIVSVEENWHRRYSTRFYDGLNYDLQQACSSLRMAFR